MIREIKHEDHSEVARLSTILGYPLDKDLAKELVEEIIQHPDHFAYIKEVEGKVIGYIHCFRAKRLTVPSFIEIAGLVVSPDFRGKGIGTSLVKHIEQDRALGSKIRVRCNGTRTRAHLFYQKNGYMFRKDQKVFQK